MITEEILQIAMEQSAEEMNCKMEDFINCAKNTRDFSHGMN